MRAAVSYYKRWLFLGAAILLVAAAPAFACAPQTKAKAEPARAEAGSVTTVHGTGFDASGGPVEIYWGGADGTLLATASANAEGNFSQQVTVPSDAQPGNYWMQASQGTRTANFEFEVTPSQQTQEPPPAQDPAPDQSAPDESTNEDSAPEQQPASGEESTESQSLPEGSYEPAYSGAGEPAAEGQQETQPATQPEAGQQVAAPAGTTGQTSTSGEQAATGTQSTVQEQAAEPAAGTDQGEAVAEEQVEEPAMPAAEEPDTGEEQSQVEPMPMTGDLGEGHSVSVGPSPGVLVPLAVVALGLLIFGSAVATRELRQRRAPVELREE